MGTQDRSIRCAGHPWSTGATSAPTPSPHAYWWSHGPAPLPCGRPGWAGPAPAGPCRGPGERVDAARGVMPMADHAEGTAPVIASPTLTVVYQLAAGNSPEPRI